MGVRTGGSAAETGPQQRLYFAAEPHQHRSLRPGGQRSVSPVRPSSAAYSARSSAEFDALCQELDALHQVPWDDRCFDRAEEVQAQLARRGLHHRSVKLFDLLVAAGAERTGDIPRVLVVGRARAHSAVAHVPAPRGTARGVRPGPSRDEEDRSSLSHSTGADCESGRAVVPGRKPVPVMLYEA
jgi:hypothetical protein